MSKEYQIQFLRKNGGWKEASKNCGWQEATGLMRSTFSKREYAEEALAIYLRNQKELKTPSMRINTCVYRIAVREVGEWEEDNHD